MRVNRTIGIIVTFIFAITMFFCGYAYKKGAEHDNREWMTYISCEMEKAKLDGGDIAPYYKATEFGRNRTPGL